MSTEITKSNSQENQLAETRPERTIRPAYEVFNEDHAYRVRVAMPGVSKEGLTITLENDELLIHGNKSSFRKSDWQPVFQEISEASYQLRLQLNVSIDEDKIGAKIEEGILQISLPVSEEAKPRSITVE